MKKLLLIVVLLLNVLQFTNQISAQTTKTVGVGANYATLKIAFDSINAGKITGAITLQIISSITETAAAVIYASGTGSASYTSVIIYPTGTGYIISGSLATPLIDLNGADNITIDGSVNGTGSTKDLVISNLSTSTVAGTSTIRFINDATNDTIKYCTLKGSTTSTTSGIIMFSTTTLTNGNDGNVIDNNNITNATDASRSLNAVYS